MQESAVSSIQIPRRFTSDSWGGTETVVLETAKCSLAMNNPTRIFTSQALSSSKQETMDGIEVRRFSYFYPYIGLSLAESNQLDLKAGNLFSWSMLAALCLERNAQIYHLHTGNRLGGIVRTAARLRKIPYVVSLHGGLLDVPLAERESWTKPTRDKLEWGKVLGALVGSRKVLRDAAAVFCLSKQEELKLRQAYPSTRIELLPNGVDYRKFQSRPNAQNSFSMRFPETRGKRVILTVARIDPQKNQLLALQALAALLSRGHNVHLCIVGPVTDNEYFRTLQHTTEKLGLSSRVSFCGLLNGQDLVDAYHESALFFLPSRHEPFGIVILEAWASELPVVASAVGGINDLVSSGHNGLLFAADDSAEAVLHLETLLSDEELGHSLRQAGATKVRQCFDWSFITSRLLNVYREVLQLHQGSRSPVRR